jgi:hypothetical protein
MLKFLLLALVGEFFSNSSSSTSRKPRIYDWCLRLVFSRRRHFTTILLLVA